MDEGIVKSLKFSEGNTTFNTQPKASSTPYSISESYSHYMTNLVGKLDRVKKPSEETTMVAPIASHNTEEIKTSQNITLDQISKLIDTKLDKVLPRKEIRDTIIDVGIFLFPDKGEIQGLITLEKK